MSATIARIDGPSTADAAPSTAELAASTADVAVSTADVVPESENAAPAVTEAAEAEQPVDIEEVEHQHRALAIARIRLSSAPAELKEKLAGVVETTGNAAAVEACLKAVEESLPEFLKQNRGEGARVGHPAGEVFFRGTSEEMTDAQAEELAQKQLSRSGLLRGQRVKVAD